MRSLTWIGLFAGSTIGSLLPAFFGASTLGFWSLFFAFIGGLIGIWIGRQYEENL